MRFGFIPGTTSIAGRQSSRNGSAVSRRTIASSFAFSALKALASRFARAAQLFVLGDELLAVFTGQLDPVVHHVLSYGMCLALKLLARRRDNRTFVRQHLLLRIRRLDRHLHDS